MIHSYRRPAGNRAGRRRACTNAVCHRLVLPALLLVMLLLAGGCASQSASTIDRPVYNSAPKKVKSSRVVMSNKGADVVETARSLIGTPYKWGGRSPSIGFDCSGFVGYVYGRHGMDMPRTSNTMESVGRDVMGERLRPGDIVIYNVSKKGKSLHVGIATGSGTFVHSPSSGKGVSESSMSLDYWKSHFIGARRVF